MTLARSSEEQTRAIGRSQPDRGDRQTRQRIAPSHMNPIIRRELLEVLRTRKAVALQLGLALACALLVLVRWPTGDTGRPHRRPSLEVLRIFGYGLLAGILLLVPAFPADLPGAREDQGDAGPAAQFAACGRGRSTSASSAACWASRRPAGDDAARGGGLLRPGRDGRRRAASPLLYVVLAVAAVQTVHAGAAGQQPLAVHRRRPPRHLRPGAGGRASCPWCRTRCSAARSDPLARAGLLAALPVAGPRRHGSAGAGRRGFARLVRRRRRGRPLRPAGPGRQRGLRPGHGAAAQPHAARPGAAGRRHDGGPLRWRPDGSRTPPLPGRPAAALRQHEPVGQPGHGEGVPLAPLRPVALDAAAARRQRHPVAGASATSPSRARWAGAWRSSAAGWCCCRSPC